MKEVDGSLLDALVALQMALHVFFAVVFFLRLAVAPGWRAIVLNIDTYCDLLALTPLVVRLALADDDVNLFFDPLVLLRIVRVSQPLTGTKVLMEAMSNSAEALTIPLFLFIVLVGGFSVLLFLAEFDPNADNEACEKDTITDILRASWLIVATATSVGYGDVSPSTTLGRFVCVMAMLVGLVYLAMPIAVVGANFKASYEKQLMISGERIRDRVHLLDVHSLMVARYSAAARDAARALVLTDTPAPADTTDPRRRRLSAVPAEHLFLLGGGAGGSTRELNAEVEKDGGASLVSTNKALEDALHKHDGSLYSAIAEAVSTLRAAHGELASVLDYVQHRFAGQTLTERGWAQDANEVANFAAHRVVGWVGRARAHERSHR